jgi:hypothetical protein
MAHPAHYTDTTRMQGIFEKYSTRFSCLKWDLNITKSAISLTILKQVYFLAFFWGVGRGQKDIL